MVAFNQIGEANVAAQEVTGYSGEDVPLEAPSNFTLNQIIDERSAILSWNPVNPDSVQGNLHRFFTCQKQFKIFDPTKSSMCVCRIQGTSKATKLRRGQKRKEKFVLAR